MFCLPVDTSVSNRSRFLQFLLYNSPETCASTLNIIVVLLYIQQKQLLTLNCEALLVSEKSEALEYEKCMDPMGI